MRDLYSVLQVAPKASDAEIKTAFRSRAKASHPDMKPGDREAEETFQEVKRAYEFLSNPETRKLYDKFLADRRAAARVRFRRAVATMSATFLVTAAVVLVAMLLLQEHGRLLAWSPERGPDVARAATEEPDGAGKAETDTEPGARLRTVRGTPAGP
jgi:curved DNA-binding protein CbpA